MKVHPLMIFLTILTGFAGLTLAPTSTTAAATPPGVAPAIPALNALIADPPVWLEQKVAANDGLAGDSFGNSVAVSGNIAVIGAPYVTINGHALQGAAYVFTRTAGVWHQTARLTVADGVAREKFGTSVAISGNRVLIGAPGGTVFLQPSVPGAAYLFTKTGGQWTQTAKFTDVDDDASAAFGSAVALDGDHALIGAPSAAVNGNYGQGDAYLYTRANGDWSQTARLVSDDGSFGDIFGGAVALSDGMAVVAARGAAINGNFSQGAVYVFTNPGSGWSQNQKLTASDGTGGAVFGLSLALSGNTLLIGAPDAQVGNNSFEGAAYIFNYQNGSWTQTQRLTREGGGANDNFGEAVALAGNIAIVTSQAINYYEGAAYVFTLTNGSWRQTLQLNASDQEAFAQFGSAVALSGTTALVGANEAAVGANGSQGAAYFYDGTVLDLAVSAPDRVNPGSRFTTSTIATNSAGTSSPAVAVSIAVPAAASFISATTTQGDCSEAAGVVHCEFGAIAGNAGVAKADVTLKALGRGGETIASRAEVVHATPPLSAAAATAINHLPVADDGRLAAAQGGPTSGTLKAGDADGDPLVFSIARPPVHGSITLNDVHKGVYTYTPDSGYAGADNFGFKVNDGYADSNVATVIVAVANQPPTASNGTLTTDMDVAANGTLKASDPDGDPLTYSVVAPPGHGSVTLDAATGAYTYTPAASYFGNDGFTFKVNDGGSDSNVATISITVQGSAPPPPPPPSDNGGGGGFSALLLALLATLAGAIALSRLLRSSRNAAPAIRSLPEGSRRKETFMRRKELTKTTVGAMILALLGLVPLASQAQPVRTTGDKSGYRAGLAMPLPAADTIVQNIALAPQSNLKLLARATRLGPHAGDSTIEIIVGLKLRNVPQLKTFLDQVQNPGSAIYHQFLTPQQFTKLYGPSQADVTQVTAFLKAHGIQVESVSANRTLIHTRATTTAYEHAFGVQINDYKLDGRSFYSTTDRPKLPRAIAPLVTNILGLNHGAQMQPLSRLHAKYTSNVSPQAAPPPSTAYFNPQQIAKAYDWPDITDTDNGAGVSIAILTAETPNVGSNPNYHNFWSAYGLPDHTINVIPIGGASDSGGEPETALDIEWSGAMAPGATLNVYVAANGASDTFTAMYNQFVIDNTSQVMTTSWGLSETGVPDINRANEQIFMQAAAQGISMFAATGDYGASDCNPFGYCPPGPNNADFPSSSEYITAANGTDLSISDVSGTYDSETAWPNSGGAISVLFDKPDWQTGPGVPTGIDMRMNSDLALNAGGVHPYVVYATGPQGPGFYPISGTSAVAPILSGLFAIGVSQQPGDASLGQSNSLLYNDVNANDTNYASDFHDVTTGCNGYLPDGTTPSCAAANWDHPTGWGSPRAKSLLSHLGVHGPAGVLKGTLTDAASGAPVAGATVTVTADGFSESRTTKADGSYLMALNVGTYTVAVIAFGYNDASATVSITDGGTATRDFALTAAPTVTLSGTVSDGSGHGYGLYAEIKANVEGFGQVADFWSDPATGKYSVELPKGFDYNLTATAAFNGYKPATATLSLPADKTQNFSLTVTDACTAPGYATAFSEDFNTAWPPEGWTITNTVDGSLVFWQPNINWGSDNWTGGTGFAAEASSGGAYPYFGPYDTSLVTPPIEASAVRANPILRYKANYQPAGIMQKLDLDISTDGGANWTTMLHWTNDTCGAQSSLPGCTVHGDISQWLPATGTFQLRWHYYDDNQYAYDQYAQIDDVHIGACQAIPGGLVFGQVTDANTDDGIIWAEVTDDLGDKVDTTSNPADPAFPTGGYLLFVPAGARTLTASDYRYRNASASFTVKEGILKVQNFALDAGRLASDPDQFNLHVMVNNQKTRSLSVSNTGSAKAYFKIVSVNAPPPATDEAAGKGAPLIRIKGDFSPLRLTPARMKAAKVQAQAAPTPHAAPWQDIASYPVAVMDNAAVRDPTTGIIYSVDGVSDGDYLNAIYAYDPATNAWTLAAHNAVAREAPQAAFIGGKLYVVGGWLSTGGQAPQLEIYDPATGQWSAGAAIPAAWAGAGHAVVDGKLYVVGGCGDDCDSADVQVYDPASNTWSKAADYPHPVAWVACGSIGGKLYCAGGTSGLHTLYKDAYVYDPASDQWSSIRDLPTYLWGAGAAAADGALLVSGGISGFRTLTNAGYAYDPVTNRWHDLPNSNYALFRGGSACGFYKIGGSRAGFLATPSAEMLPGYAQCGTPTAVSWLTPAPPSGTLAAGASVQATLIFDGTGQQEFTTSRAYLKISGNTPYAARIVPLTVTWDPQPVNLVLSGDVSPVSVRKGNDLAYTLTVHNRQADNHGAATEVKLVYTLPRGVSYEAASGDANACTEDGGTVACDFGTIALGASKTETLAVKTVGAGRLASDFKVSAREPDSKADDNSLTLTSEVLGTADLALSADPVSIPAGGTGNLTLTLKNAGPDPASEVVVHVKPGSDAITFQSATASQGSCALSGGALACELGQVNVGDSVTVTLALFGAYAGSATVNAQASTASNEPDGANNGVAVKVAVNAPAPPDNGGDSGGGALGWLALLTLAGLAFGDAYTRRRRL